MAAANFEPEYASAASGGVAGFVAQMIAPRKELLVTGPGPAPKYTSWDEVRKDFKVTADLGRDVIFIVDPRANRWRLYVWKTSTSAWLRQDQGTLCTLDSTVNKYRINACATEALCTTVSTAGTIDGSLVYGRLMDIDSIFAVTSASDLIKRSFTYREMERLGGNTARTMAWTWLLPEDSVMKDVQPPQLVTFRKIMRPEALLVTEQMANTGVTLHFSLEADFGAGIIEDRIVKKIPGDHEGPVAIQCTLDRNVAFVTGENVTFNVHRIVNGAEVITGHICSHFTGLDSITYVVIDHKPGVVTRITMVSSVAMMFSVAANITHVRVEFFADSVKPGEHSLFYGFFGMSVDQNVGLRTKVVYDTIVGDSLDSRIPLKRGGFDELSAYAAVALLPWNSIYSSKGSGAKASSFISKVVANPRQIYLGVDQKLSQLSNAVRTVQNVARKVDADIQKAKKPRKRAKASGKAAGRDQPRISS
jgi:hypothetical protein